MNLMLGIALVLGFMILVHEWGHFVMARIFGVRVDVFSIGFGPRLFGWKRGATDYRVSALPLGGYVRMAGQDLTEVDSGGAAPTGAPDELMSKPRWQRALISFAGPAVNLLLPIVLLAGFFWIRGLPYPAYLDKPPVIMALAKDDPLAKAGVTPGDRIVEVNGAPTPTWEKADQKLLEPQPDNLYTIGVEHDGTKKVVQVKGKDLAQVEAPGRYHPVVPVVGQLTKGLPAHRAGLQRGDLVVSVNGTPVTTWIEFVDIIRKSNGERLTTVVKRDGKLLTFTIQPKMMPGEDGKSTYHIGVGVEDQWAYKPMSLGASVRDASVSTWYGTRQLLGVVGRLFAGKLSVKQLLGPVGIADQAGQAVQEGAFAVINLMAIISLNLGILNLLPIPILDGGHILLLAIEGGMRRDLSVAFKERFVQVGLVFLLVLFGIVMYNDVVRLLPIHS
jgi:regulator of sigma E protease